MPAIPRWSSNGRQRSWRECWGLFFGHERDTLEAKAKLEYTMKEDWDQTVRSRSREAGWNGCVRKNVSQSLGLTHLGQQRSDGSLCDTTLACHRLRR